MLAVRNNNRIFPRLEPLWDDPLTASLAASVAPPPLKECFSGRRIVFVTGRENDKTGLYYYRARYYSPTLQRFIREDPIGFYGGINFYAYVRNNPVNWRDPWGLWTYANEYGTTGTGLTANMTGIEGSVDSVFQNIVNGNGVVTYTTNGTHSANSLHYSGNAVDLRTRNMTDAQRQEATTQLQNSLGNNYDVLNEDNHIHIEYDPPSPPSPSPPTPTPPGLPPAPPNTPCRGRKC